MASITSLKFLPRPLQALSFRLFSINPRASLLRRVVVPEPAFHDKLVQMAKRGSTLTSRGQKLTLGGHQKEMNITFKEFTLEDVPLYYEWAEREHVKNIWFLDGYQPKEFILKKIEGNGIDYPFVILDEGKPIGHIQFWDVHARDLLEKEEVDYFTGSPPGTFGIDLFIGEEEYLGKGYGTEILRKFTRLLFEKYQAQKIVIDPNADNIRAIKSYQKAGFKFSRVDHDPVSGETWILEMEKPLN